MKEAVGDLFKLSSDAKVITTNGFTKADGKNVMGKGCAKRAASLYPELSLLLGYQLELYGNKVHHFNLSRRYTLVTFPVKPITGTYDRKNVVAHMKHQFKVGDEVPGWAMRADLDIIVRSAHELLTLANEMGWKKVLLPRPGCGAGELRWEEVGPLLHEILDDRFTALTLV